MEKMESVLRRFHLMKEPRESDARQQLKKELFAFNTCVEHGFPNKPTALAFDSKLQLLAIGNKSGDLRIYGTPGVEFSGHHSSFVAVNRIFFIEGQGRLVTLCSDNSLHLWQLDTKDGQSFLQELKGISPDPSKLKPVTAACLSTDGRHLLLGTDAGTIHRLDILSFQLDSDKVIQKETLVQLAPEDARANPGKIETLVRNPTEANQYLIGFKHGLVVLWDVDDSKALHTYLAPQSQNLESLAFHHDGREFLSAHADGSYVTWTTADSSRPKEQSTTPYGPFPCKAINKIVWKSDKLDPFVIFSGGMPRASHGDRNTVSVIQGQTHVAFDLTSQVIDFVVLCSAESESGDKTGYDEPHSLLILAEEELVAIDLVTPGWPLYDLPYLSSIHASAILSASHVTNVTQSFWDRLIALGAGRKAKFSSRIWPIKGGKDLRTSSTARDLLLTGHEDGSVRFWDVSGTCMRLLYKLSTSTVFGIDTASPFDAPKSPDGEDEWPPFRKVGTFDPFSDDPQLGVQKILLCCQSETLFVGGTAGQVIVLNFNAQEADQEIKVVPLVIVREHDTYVWKGHDPLTVKSGSSKYPAGFQPTCVVQVQPPVMCTALTVSDQWQLLAVGTAVGFGVVDYGQKKSVFEKCTLGASGEPTTPRRRSLRRSLRESFRRLRKRRIPLPAAVSSVLHRRTASPSATEKKPEAAAATAGVEGAAAEAKPPEEVKPDQPASPTAAAPAAEATATEVKMPVTDAVEAKPAAESAAAPATAAAASSGPPSPTATTPPMSPQRSTDKQESRSADEMTTSIVRCLTFADTFIINGQEHSPTLWVGTNAGTVYIHQLTIPASDKRATDEVQCILAKEIQLRHRAPVISVNVLDRAMLSVSGGYIAGEFPHGKQPDMSGGHQAIVTSEEQIKIFTLPSLKPGSKYRTSTHDGAKIRKTGVIGFSSKSDEKYLESDVGCLSTNGEIHILSLPQLRQQMKAEGIKCDNTTVNASLFTLNGDAFFLNSPSEYLRFSLSASHVVKPSCLVELSGDRAPLQLEPEPSAAQPAAQPANNATAPAAPEIQVVITAVDQQQPTTEESTKDKTEDDKKPEQPPPTTNDTSTDVNTSTEHNTSTEQDGTASSAEENQPTTDAVAAEVAADAEDDQQLNGNDAPDGNVAGGDTVILHISEQSSSSSVVKNVISSRTIVTETTVSRTTGDGTVTETSSSVQHFNTGGVEIVEGTKPMSSAV